MNQLRYRAASKFRAVAGSRSSRIGRACVALALAAGSAPAEAVVLVDVASTVERVMAGVVNIRTRDVVRENAGASGADVVRHADKFFERFLLPGGQEAFRESRSMGSGFFIRGKQYIVTNHHVVKDAETIEVIVHGRRYPARARIVGNDATVDIAVLKVERVDEAVSLAFGNSQRTRVGEGVFTIGNPFGYGHTVTSGILSARNRTIGQGPYDDYIQTDAAVNPGNSGGPLFNLHGEVIGINTALLADARGISFAIPSETARRVTDAIIDGKQSNRTWLGIVSQDLVESEGATREEAYGVVVRNLAKGSPAHRAGLLTGDVILAVNDASVRHSSDLQKAVGALAAGRRVELRVFRKGASLSVSVTLSRMPDSESLRGISGLY